MKPTILICALLAVPLCSHAADQVAEKPVAPLALGEEHSADDGHDHGATAGEDGPTDALWRQSDVAFHAGDYPRAVELHREIVKLDPTDTESYGVGAWLLWSLDKKADANAFIAEGLKHNPDDAEMWNVAAQQYGLEKEFVLERDAYVKAVALAGEEADQMLRRRFAHASENAGDLKASARIWRALVTEFPDDAVNKNNLARVEAAMKGDGKVVTAGALGALFLLSCGVWNKRKRND